MLRSYVRMNLRKFDNTQTTGVASGQGSTAWQGSADLSPTMKTYYSKRLIDNAVPALVHDQFGDDYDIPKGNGRTIEMRKFSRLPKALTPLTEGVTPSGRSLSMSYKTAVVDQFGDYIERSDMLDMSAYDNIKEECAQLLGQQAGETLDTITRETLNGGTFVMYAPKVSGGSETPVLSRKDLDTTACLTPKAVRLAVAQLKRQNAPKINGKYVAIIHTDVASDLMGDTNWLDVHKYAQPDEIYQGEIGELYGCRFVETTEAKIWSPEDMLGLPGYKRTTLNADVSDALDIYPVDVFTTTEATAINAAITDGAVYKIYVDETECTVASVTGGAKGTCKITLAAKITASKDDVVCGIGGGKDGSAVYSTLFLGAKAYGKTKLEDGGLEFIMKQLGSSGSADPLNQRATVGWKASKVAEILVEENMVRVESSSATYGAEAIAN